MGEERSKRREENKRKEKEKRGVRSIRTESKRAEHPLSTVEIHREEVRRRRWRDRRREWQEWEKKL